MSRDLAAAQEALLAAVIRGAPPPEGFDPERVRALADSLAAKRVRTAKRLWPALARCLEDRFESELRRIVMAHPLAKERAALLDGMRLAEAFEADLSSDAALELARVRLRYRVTAEGLKRRPFAVTLSARHVGVAVLGKAIIRAR